MIRDPPTNATPPSLLPQLDSGDGENIRTQVGAYSWPSRFFKRQDVALEWENFPWVKRQETAPHCEDAMAYFFSIDEDSAQDQYRLESILDVCAGTTLIDLQNKDNIDQQKVAILIECSQNAGVTRFRPSAGALSARQLLDELLKERYNLTGLDTGVIDAERRLIYINDLDKWSILSLVGSAPETLARQLCGFIFKYVASRSAIGVSFATDGPETFSLEFSFPLRVWRCNSVLMQDPRIKQSDGEPLRCSKDVTYLRQLSGLEHKTEKTDGIYSGQISCLVTGYDQYRWTGLMLVDTFFEEAADNPAPDFVSRYANDIEDGMLFEPFGRGRDDAAKLPWLPRQHFLRAMEVRIMQCKREWEGLHWYLDKRIKGTTRRHRELLAEMQEATKETPLSGRREQVLKVLEMGITDFKALLRELFIELQETVRSGQLFMKTDVNFFLSIDGKPDDGVDCFRHLSQIRKRVNELHQLQMRFDDMQSLCKEMLEDIEASRKKYLLQLQIGGVKSMETFENIPRPTSEQQPTSIVAIVTWMAILTQPIVITAGIFSCDDIIIVERNWKNFVFTFLAISAVMILIGTLCWLAWKLRDRLRLKRQSPTLSADSPNSMLTAADADNQHPATQLFQRKPTFFTTLIDTKFNRNRNRVMVTHTGILHGQIELQRSPASTGEPRNESQSQTTSIHPSIQSIPY